MGKDEFDDLKKLKNLALTGGLTIESSKLISQAGDIRALTGAVPGFVGIGIAGAASDVAFDLATGRRRKRKRG